MKDKARLILNWLFQKAKSHPKIAGLILVFSLMFGYCKFLDVKEYIGDRNKLSRAQELFEKKEWDAALREINNIENRKTKNEASDLAYKIRKAKEYEELSKELDEAMLKFSQSDYESVIKLIKDADLPKDHPRFSEAENLLESARDKKAYKDIEQARILFSQKQYGNVLKVLENFPKNHPLREECDKLREEAEDIHRIENQYTVEKVEFRNDGEIYVEFVDANSYLNIYDSVTRVLEAVQKIKTKKFKTLRIVGMGTLVDKYGQESVEPTVKFTFSYDTIRKLNLDNAGQGMLLSTASSQWWGAAIKR